MYHNCTCKKNCSLIITYHINNGKMNITGLSGSINGIKLSRIIPIEISECGRWPY